MALHRHTIDPAYHFKYEVLDGDGGLIASFVEYEDRELFITAKEEKENNRRLKERLYRLKKE